MHGGATAQAADPRCRRHSSSVGRPIRDSRSPAAICGGTGSHARARRAGGEGRIVALENLGTAPIVRFQ